MIQKQIEKLLVYTPEEIQHLMKCRVDPKYFIENDFKIEKNHREYYGKFKLYDYQKDIIDHFLNHSRSQCNGIRQFGMTTLMAAYATWMVATQANKTILVIADSSDSSKHLFEIIRYAISNLPKQYNLNFIENNKSFLRLNNNIRLVRASTSCGVRGRYCNLLLVDNADFCKPDMIVDLIPVMTSNCQAIFAGHNTNFPNMTIPMITIMGEDKFNKDMVGL